MREHPTSSGEWLEEPGLELFRDRDGRVESAYIKFRDAPYARAVQPSEQHLVFFYVAADGWPVGIRLLEPVCGTFGAQVLSKLLDGTDVSKHDAASSDLHTCTPMTLEQLDAVIHKLQSASEELLEATR